MIVLIAIAAIVVDLGFSWMLHRKEVNAVDPGSLAAAKWIRDTPASGTKLQAMEAEACFYAQQNGFFVGDPGCTAALLSKDLDVNWPPSSTLSGQYRGNFGYVEVLINASHPSFFGQVFGRSVGWVRSEAVAALTNGTAASGSLMALSDSCTTGVGGGTVSGGAQVKIHPASYLPPTTPGGYVNVNATCGSIGNPQACDGGGSSALDIAGNSSLTVPHAFVTGGCAGNGGTGLTCLPGFALPCLDEQAIPVGDALAGLPRPWTPTVNLAGLPYPSCPFLTGAGAKVPSPNLANDANPCVLDDKYCPTTGSGPTAVTVCTMTPGVYYAGWSVGGGKVQLHLQPGMYVFAGGGIQCNSGCSIDDVTGGGGSIPAKITIFSTDGPMCGSPGGAGQCEGPIQFRSNATGKVILHATDTVSCAAVSPAICPWKGLLIWQDGLVPAPQDIIINGGSVLDLSGTIYAPASYVTIDGGNATGASLAIQLISQGWKLTGNATIDMPYDPALFYQLEQQGLVH
jgi:hypothetical protein